MNTQRGLLPFEDLRLHIAALTNDIETAKQLLQAGFNIHMRDIYFSTPLHLAAFNGHTEIAQLLIEAGAKVDSESYMKVTPLSLAIQNHHADMVSLLVKAGADPNFAMKDGGTPYHLLNKMIVEQLNFLYSSDEDINTITTQIKMFEHLANPEYGQPIFNLSKEVSMPASVMMSLFAFGASQPELQSIITDAYREILVPELHQFYIDTKSVLHAFGVRNRYEVEIPDIGVLNIQSEGHWGHLTTELAENSIFAFTNEVKQQHQGGLKHSIFESIDSVLKDSDYLLKNISKNTANDTLEKYKQGDMVLLPTGWDGHFITFILHDNILIVCNSGQRFQLKITGATIYEITQPEALNPDLILEIIGNENQMDLEYNLHYKLGLIPIHNLQFPDQEAGNCAWYSFLPAVKSMIFLNLSNMGIEMQHAEKMTEDYFNEWHEFHKSWILDNYLEKYPNTNFDILMDIFVKEATAYEDEANPRLDALFKVLSESPYEDKLAEFVQNKPIAWIGIDDELHERGLNLHTGRKAILDIQEVLNYNDLGFLDDKVQLMVPPHLQLPNLIVDQVVPIEL